MRISLRTKYAALSCAVGLTVSVALFALPMAATHFREAVPGYRYRFPRDHFNHADFATEWWYYTGNLETSTGRQFGFELTFFRQASRGTASNPASLLTPDEPTVWRPDPLFLAHFAVSDIEGHSFFHTERLNRPGPGLAGITASPGRYWNGNWQVRWLNAATAEQQLTAVANEANLDLLLTPLTPPVIHGQEGISRKGNAPGQASHYISFPRLAAKGTLQWKGQSFSLTGLAWMDHEFFSSRLDPSLAGWDWFSVQLSNGEDLMFYRLRSKDGSGAPVSSATFVDAQGAGHFLSASAFTLTPGRTWRSPVTHAVYPIAWSIQVPSLRLTLTEDTALRDQELASGNALSPSYWEGAVRFQGQRDGRPVTGVGYLEMTGYDQPVGRFGL